MRKVFIYALIDPRTDAPFYVGQTTTPTARLGAHRSECSSANKKSRIIKELYLAGLAIEMEVLHITTDEESLFWEQHYIFLYRSFGFDLTNRVAFMPFGSKRKDVMKGDHELVVGDRIGSGIVYKPLYPNQIVPSVPMEEVLA